MRTDNRMRIDVKKLQNSKGTMARIREISNTEPNIIEDVVKIHLSTFQGFFLTFMGRGFLRQMYRSYCEHEKSGLLVAFGEIDQSTNGFLAYSNDMSDLYKHMIKKKLIYFAWYSIGAIFRKPASFHRLIRAFLKPSEAKGAVSFVEISSVGVKPDAKSKGVGSQLINELKNRVDFSTYKYIRLETDAVGNELANHFYKKNGFEVQRVFMTREGRMMNEYRYAEEKEFESIIS